MDKWSEWQQYYKAQGREELGKPCCEEFTQSMKWFSVISKKTWVDCNYILQIKEQLIKKRKEKKMAQDFMAGGYYRKNIQCHLSKMVRQILSEPLRYNRPLWWEFTVGRNEIGLHSEYSKDKWEFTAREQVGVSAWQIRKRKIRGLGVPAKPT